MAVSPNTIIKLLKVPIEIDNFNQLKFASKQAQYNYFNSLPKITEENLSYQRKDNFIWFPAHIDTILQYNYCMYQNSNYSDKWFYAFITDMQYENDGTTRIYIETDVFQTWQFDIVYKPSFVEREHTNDDTIGNNLIPENLQLGEYTCNKKLQWLNGLTSGSAYTGTNLVIVLGASENPEGELTSGVQVNGIYAGLHYYVFHNNSDGIHDLNEWLEQYADEGKSDAIQCMFLMPEFLTTGADRDDHLYAGSNTANTKYINHGEESIVNKNLDLTNTNLDGYEPKNNKLKTFPFSYLLVSNNSGTDVIYRYENFFTLINNVKTLVSNPQFKIHSCMTPSRFY